MERISEFFDKMLAFLDSGDLFRKSFKLIFGVFGLLSAGGLLCGIFALFNEINSYWPGNAKVAVVFVNIVLLAAVVFSALYWFKRAAKANEAIDEDSKFVAVPAISLLIRCLGEYFGILFGVFGTVIVFLSIIFGAGESLDIPVFCIIICPIAGFFYILLSRVFAESCVALIRIADDVRRISSKK